MNFSISKKVLLDSLNKISSGLATKTPSPILTGILLSVNDDGITLVASNREISIREIIPKTDQLTVKEKGTILIPGSYFIEIVKKIEDLVINVTLFDESSIKITTERSQFSLNLLDKESYPNFSFDEKGEVYTISAKILKKIVRQTSFATSTSKDRLNLSAVHFEIEPNQLRVVATDSYRLSEFKRDYSSDITKRQINVPSSSLDELCKTLNDDNIDVELHIFNNKVIFKYNNTSFISRVIEGVYPNTTSFFEKESMFSVTFNKQMLVSAIERINLFSLDDYKLIKIIFTKDNKIKLSSISNEIGVGEESIYPISITDNIPFVVSFSSKYMLEALKAIDGCEVTISFAGEIKPFIIKSEQDQEVSELILAARVF